MVIGQPPAQLEKPRVDKLCPIADGDKPHKRSNQRTPAGLGVWGRLLEGPGATLCWWSLIWAEELKKRLNCGAERHHFSMFNVGC